MLRDRDQVLGHSRLRHVADLGYSAVDFRTGDPGGQPDVSVAALAVVLLQLAHRAHTGFGE
jgi:hypothetical protein